MADPVTPAGLHLDYKASNGLTYPVDAADEHQANQVADWVEERIKAGDPTLKGPQPFKIDTIPGTEVVQSPPPPASDGGKSFLDTGVGMASRYLAKGAAAMPGMLFDATLNDPGATGKAIDELFDKAGARNSREGDEGFGDRMVGSVFQGLGGLGAMGKLAAPAEALGGNSIANVLRAAPTSQIIGTTTGSLAGQDVAENGGDWKAQLLASILAGTAPSGIKSVIDATRRGVMRGSSPTGVIDAIKTFAPAGETPTVGQAVGGRPAEVEAFLSQFFPSSKKVVNRYQEQEANIGNKLGEKADELYPSLSNSDMGAMVSSEANEGFKPNGRSIVDTAYDNLQKKLPLDTKVDMGPFQDYISGKASIDPAAKYSTTNPLLGGGDQYKWAQLGADLQKDLKANPGGGLPLSAVKTMRTNIGRMIDNAAFDSSGGDIGALRGAYGVLSEGMKSSAEKAGALDLYNKANGLSNWYHDILGTTQPILDKNGGFEQVFKAALGGMKEGGTKLQNTYYLLQPEARRAMTAQILRRAATPTAGDPEAFDMFKFAKNMGNMDPEAKAVIFDPKVVGKDFPSDIDNITETIRRIEEMKTKFGAATSPAQGRLGAQMMLGGILTGPIGLLTSAMTDSHAGMAGAAAITGGTVGAAVGAHSMASWFTNPKTVHWLAETTKLPVQQIPIAINQLEQEGAKQKDPEMIELAHFLKQRYALQNQGDQ